MMSGVIRIPPSLRLNFQQKTPNNIMSPSHQLVIKTASSLKTSVHNYGVAKASLKSRSSSEEVGPPPLPLSLELKRVSSETEFDLFLHEAKSNGEPVVVLWMASWCRKCIYLKPKLEKLAAQYDQRVRFYCVDVNGVSHKFVVRAEVTLFHYYKQLENAYYSAMERWQKTSRSDRRAQSIFGCERRPQYD